MKREEMLVHPRENKERRCWEKPMWDGGFTHKEQAEHHKSAAAAHEEQAEHHKSAAAAHRNQAEHHKSAAAAHRNQAEHHKSAAAAHKEQAQPAVLYSRDTAGRKRVRLCSNCIHSFARIFVVDCCKDRKQIPRRVVVKGTQSGLDHHLSRLRPCCNNNDITSCKWRGRNVPKKANFKLISGILS